MTKGTLIMSVCALLLAGCTRETPKETTAAPEADKSGAMPEEIQIQMRNREGANVGTVTATNTAAGVRLQGRVTGITPGEHGFHIHAVGKCDPPDFSSAGGHYNPTTAHHGTENPQTPKPHVGDLGNLNVSSDGVANIDVVANNATIGQGQNSLVTGEGTALMIHADPDDLKSDPSGNAGDRVACGVISTASM